MKAAVYCLDRMGARAVGMKALESFMKQHGESLSLVLMLGVLQFQENALEKAAETFRKAVSLSPQDWRANRNLGMVYRKMGNDVFAEKFLAKAAAPARGAEAAAEAAPQRPRQSPSQARTAVRSVARDAEIRLYYRVSEGRTAG